MINFIKARLKNETLLFIPFWITCFFVVSFIVAVPVYLDSLNQLTVINTLKEQKGYNSDLMFTTQWMPMIKNVVKEKQQVLDDLLKNNISSLVSDKKDLLSSQKFFWGFSEKNIDKAKIYCSTNPRPYYLSGQSKFYTPSAFGGGVDKALPLLKEAIGSKVKK